MTLPPEPSPKSCPGCSAAMGATPLEAPSAFSCFKCGGLWLLPDELEPYLRRLALDPAVEQGAFLREAAVVAHGDTLQRPRSSLRCPACGDALERLNYGYDSNILIERCEAGHGVWLRRDQRRALASFVKGHQSIEPLIERLRADRRKREEKEERNANLLYAASAMVPLPPGAFIPVDTDETADRAPAVLVGLLVAANVAVYAAEPSGLAARRFIWFFGFEPAALPSLRGLLTLVSHMFVHAGALHLASNMWALWLFGRDVENKLGPGRFLRLYLLSGLAGAFADILLGYIPWQIPRIGASAAIAGLIAAFLRLFPGSRIVTRSVLGGTSRLSGRLFIGIWFAQQVYFFFTRPTAHINWIAHIGGFTAGYFLAGARLTGKENP